MGAEQSIPPPERRMQASPVDSLPERAVLDTLGKIAEESEQIEHAWDPEYCSPRFRVLSDRLTARRLPSNSTTDAIRGKQLTRKSLIRNVVHSNGPCSCVLFPHAEMRRLRNGVASLVPVSRCSALKF